jgi:type IV secretion system protein TrbL
MDDLGIIDQFVKTFSDYIESGFGLIDADVHFLTAFIIGIDITLAGLYWAMGSDSSVIGKFLKKVLYVGVFALIINNFSSLATIIFDSFGQLGLNATNSTMTAKDLLRPGFIANTGYEAAHPLLNEVGELLGPVKFFTNFVTIVVLLLAWVITLFAFFFLAIQLFVTIIEFKLTTLAGFILIPFALWNKTSFLAEKVLGNVVSSGIKLMVLAIIVGIGSTIFSEITSAFTPGEVELKDAASVILGSLAILALGLFGPGIATGLVSGAPQLGAGAAVGTMAAVGAGALAGGAMAGAGAKGAAAATGGAVKAGASMVGGSKVGFALGKMAAGGSGVKGAIGGLGGVAQTGAMSVVRKGADMASKAGGAVSAAHTRGMHGGLRATTKNMKPLPKAGGGGSKGEPNWAKKAQRQQKTRSAGRTASNAIRGADRGGSGSGPSLNPDG